MMVRVLVEKIFVRYSGQERWAQKCSMGDLKMGLSQDCYST